MSLNKARALKASCALYLLWVASAGLAHAEDFARFLQPGDSLAAALSELNRRGYQIAYASNVVLPDMRLETSPKATHIEALLREILAPWGLAAVKASDDDYLVMSSGAPTIGRRSGKTVRDEPAALETIDVTATRFGIASEQPEAQTTLTAQDVRRVPHLGDDPMRVLKTLPGVAGRDLSAMMNVRGGRADEVLMLIDGAEIHNGFHFQDGDEGFLSLIDSHLVHSIDFTTGGMTADHGDAMSGVVDIKTRRPVQADEHHHAVGISFVSSFARSGRTFADGRGSWIASARRSYLDLLMEQAQDSGERITPEYQDAFAAVGYELSDRTAVSAHALLGTDDLIVVESDSNSREAGEGETSHVWFTVDHAWSPSVQSATVLSWATGDRQRDNFDEREGEMLGDAALNAETSYIDVRQGWNWLASEDHLIRWGFSASHHEADYHHHIRSVAIDLFDPTRAVTRDDALQLETSGDKVGVYAAYRTRFGEALSIEAGGRWDSYDYDEGSSYHRLSPRLNAVYQLSERSELRAAWGIVHQPHAIDRLDVEDGQTEYHQPESARHLVLGYTTQLFDTMSLRIDAYRKDYADLRPRFENELSRARLIPEGEADRVRIDATDARTRGIEITVRRDTREQWGGWLSYSYAQAADFVDDRWRARGWEQEHSFTLGVGRSGATWDVNLAAFYHSGSPTPPINLAHASRPDGSSQFLIERGLANADRLDHYLRVDLRASREVQFKNGALTYYLEIFNLLDRENPCCVDEFELQSRGSSAELAIHYNNGFPRLPSFGFQYEF